MEDLAKRTSATESVQALLEGGPASMPNTWCIQQVSPADQKIKIQYYGGYEHFERVGEPDEHISREQIVFRWTMRTEVAE
jgi:Family of unknown function (DUF5988)